jgi:hypothetical protein
VGGLLAAGASLYLYKGFSNKENVALNIAGVLAAFVALLPTAATSSDRGLVSKLHGAAAVLFFLCLAYVSLFRSHDTLALLPPAKRTRFKQLYLWTGLAMCVSPVAAVVLSYVLEAASRSRTLIFWVESFAVFSFAAYWIIKTKEMRDTKAERRALDAELKRELVSASASRESDVAGVGGVSGTILRKLSPESGDVERIIPAAAPNVP